MQSDAKILSNAALMYNIHNEEFPLDADGEEVTIDTKLEEYLEELDPAFDSNNVARLDEELLKDYVKNTKNDIGEYFIVTKGALQGEVFHIEGIDNKEGIKQFGTF